MSTRALFVATTMCGALLARAAEPGAQQRAPEAPVAWAVLKAPLPAEAPATCAPVKRDDGSLRAALFSREGASCAAARVEDELITLADLAEALAMAHGAARGPDASAPGGLAGNVERALARLVDLRLVAHEARDMGLLDEIADAKKAIAEFEVASLRGLLERRAGAAARPDEAEVERLRREEVREWRLVSALFAKSEDAASFRTRAAKAKDVAALVREAIAAKKAEGTGEPEWVRAGAMLPQLRAAIARLAPGALTPVIPVEKGFVVARLEAVRYPESAEARESARRASLERARFAAVERNYQALAKKHARVDRKLLSRIDFEAKKPGFKALRADARVLVRLSSGAPLLVSDLAAAVGQKFFHGMERPIEEKRVNTHKEEVFQTLLRARLAQLEAAEQKLAETPEHLRAMGEYQRAVAFSTFLERVVVPGVNVAEQDVRRHYDEHQAEHTDPEMFRLDGLAFSSAEGAAGALARLRAGTDPGWLRANAEGQAKPDDVTLQLDGRVVSASSFSPALRKSLAGAARGDLRLHEEGGIHYVVRVVDEIPPRVKPYGEARDAIAKKLFGERVGRALRDYTEALRKARPVEIFLVRVEN